MISTSVNILFLASKVVVVGFESNCPLVGPGTISGAPSVGGFSKVGWLLVLRPIVSLGT